MLGWILKIKEAQQNFVKGCCQTSYFKPSAHTNGRKSGKRVVLFIAARIAFQA